MTTQDLLGDEMSDHSSDGDYDQDYDPDFDLEDFLEYDISEDESESEDDEDYKPPEIEVSDDPEQASIDLQIMEYILKQKFDKEKPKEEEPINELVGLPQAYRGHIVIHRRKADARQPTMYNTFMRIFMVHYKKHLTFLKKKVDHKAIFKFSSSFWRSYVSGEGVFNKECQNRGIYVRYHSDPNICIEELPNRIFIDIVKEIFDRKFKTFTTKPYYTFMLDDVYYKINLNNENDDIEKNIVKYGQDYLDDVFKAIV